MKEGEGPKFKGSIMLAQCDTKEEVLKVVEEDIYTKSGVWDLEKMQIYPVRTARPFTSHYC